MTTILSSRWTRTRGINSRCESLAAAVLETESLVVSSRDTGEVAPSLDANERGSRSKAVRLDSACNCYAPTKKFSPDLKVLVGEVRLSIPHNVRNERASSSEVAPVLWRTSCSYSSIRGVAMPFRFALIK